MCFAEARERAKTILDGGGTREAARLALEQAIIPCVLPSADAKLINLYGRYHYDRAIFGRDVVAGSLTLVVYQALLNERKAKFDAWRANPSVQQELLNGDSDGDFVPNTRDGCPGTTPGTPTDGKGCPFTVPPGDRTQEDNWRRLLNNGRQLYNPDCVDAPTPMTPQPLEWGRGKQPAQGTVGFNVAVAKVGGMPEGCELFYEIHFEFFDPANTALPPTKHVNVVFREGEDLLLAELHRATFGLAIGMPISSPGRAAAIQAMATQYLKIRWRVRAVNGGNLPSDWSPVIAQGPASAGVPPLP